MNLPLWATSLPLWLIYALLSAAAAALVPIFAKMGMHAPGQGNLVTVLRGLAACLVLVIFGTVMRVWDQIPGIGGRALTSIVLSGAAGAASWIFYFNALNVGGKNAVSHVAPIDKLSMPLAVLLAVLILGERPSMVNWMGILLIAGGAYLATLAR